MVGKVTPDNQLSCSALAIFDENYPYGLTKNELLDRCIRATKGENVRSNNQPLHMRTGDVLENPILQEACTRLGLTNVRLDIAEPLVHATLPFAGSPDGMARASTDRKNPIVIKSDPSKNIFTPNDKEVKLVGDGILEAKCTRDWAEDELPKWRGKDQAQGLCECADLDWYVVVVLYSSTDLRIFVFQRDPEFKTWLEETVIDFDRRVKEEDYYTPEDSNDANIIWSNAYDSLVELPNEMSSKLEDIQSAKRIIENAKQIIDDSETAIKVAMQENEHATVSKYQVRWGSRKYKAKAEQTKVIPASAARIVRNKTLTIKEVEYDDND